MRGNKGRIGRVVSSFGAAAEVESLEGRRLFSVAAPVTLSTLGNAAEAGTVPGIFRVSRVGNDRSAPLSVMLRVTGTATYGSDFTLASDPVDHRIQITIPPNETSALVRVFPIDDAIHEPTETVEVTLVAPAATTYEPIPHASLTIADNDPETPQPVPAPVAHANGPYNVPEGLMETLHGTATASGDRTIKTYQWDFSYDGITFDVNATGANPKFSAADIDGIKAGTIRTIALRVIDSANVVSAVSTSTVTIKNFAPTAKLAGSTVQAGQNGAVTFSEIKDVPADVAAGFLFRYDFNNDGTFDFSSNSPSAVVPASYLTTAGPHTVGASIRDKDDGVSTYTTTVIVKSGEPQPSATGVLLGLAFNDNNANAKFDGGDTTSGGAIIFLDTNNNGIRDNGETFKAAESNGKFSFSHLAPGTYHVRRAFREGRTYSTPLIDITLGAGQVKDGLLIGSKDAIVVGPAIEKA